MLLADKMINKPPTGPGDLHLIDLLILNILRIGLKSDLIKKVVLNRKRLTSERPLRKAVGQTGDPASMLATVQRRVFHVEHYIRTPVGRLSIASRRTA